MGIQGRLPLMKSVMVPIHIKDLEGYSVDVDTYSWLHKGALSCSMELYKSQPTSKYTSFLCSQYIGKQITPSGSSFTTSSSIASRIANLFLAGISSFYYALIKSSPFQSDSNSLDSFTINGVTEIQCLPLPSYAATPRTRLQQFPR
ncbi:hypothetical protein LXL04_032815 [Taraxacum kok-saghyz]